MNAARKAGVEPVIAKGDGAFYAPKLDFHRLAQFLGFVSVNGHHDGLLEELIFNAIRVLFQRDDSFPPRLVRESDHLVNHAVRLDIFFFVDVE